MHLLDASLGALQLRLQCCKLSRHGGRIGTSLCQNVLQPQVLA